MIWAPELFSAPALQKVLDRRRLERLRAVPYYDGFVANEPEALLESFAGVPELYDPSNGRVRGEAAFRDYIARMSGWLRDLHIEVEDVGAVILTGRALEEDLLHLDGPHGRVALPVAIVADHTDDGRLLELRIYHSGFQLTGHHLLRQPLMQPDPAVQAPDVVGELYRAIAAGDLDAVAASFVPGATVRRPSGEVESDPRVFYERVRGLVHEPCAVVDDGVTCAVEYVVGHDPPQAGVAVYQRAADGRLAAVRIYDDVAVT